MRSVQRSTQCRVLVACLGLALLGGACGGDAPAEDDPVESAGATDPTAGEPIDAAAADDTAGDAGDASPAEDAGTDAESAGDAAAADAADADGAGAGATGSAGMAGLDPLLAGYAALSEQPAWRLRQTIVSSGAGEISQVLEYQAPDRYRMQVDQMELIIVEGKTWLNAGGTWIASPEMGGMIDGVLDQLPGAGKPMTGMPPMTEVEKLGEETLDGVRTDKVRYATGDETSGRVEVTVWFRKSDGLPLRQEMQSHYGEFDAEISADFEYDASIRIEAPSS
ncbi:MAG: hypothetical protein H6648_02290 [Caldilineae bacterium]|nr:hypothetical protein [Chloroflexota bacterium]MCB9175961.1 hypothetical protein [Caldilineae bacterium]